MKLQEKLERLTMTAFERRLLKQWLAANESNTQEEEASSDDASTDEAERPNGEAPCCVEHDEPSPCTGTDGA